MILIMINSRTQIFWVIYKNPNKIYLLFEKKDSVDWKINVCYVTYRLKCVQVHLIKPQDLLWILLGGGVKESSNYKGFYYSS